MTASSSGPPARKPRRRWRWHVPPAIVHGNETLEGAEMLEEVSGAIGLVLWQTMRDVMLWAGVREPEERVRLFHPSTYEQRLRQLDQAGLDAAVEAPLRALAGILRDPGGMTEAEVLSACRDVAQWADGRDLMSVAVAFAQAGALAAPTNAAAGFKVGQLARRKAEYPRAESWFRRTIGLGRQAKDWASYAEAFLGLGNLYVQRGNYPAARRFHIRGLRAARRHGMRDIQARALHDLFGIAVVTNETAEAMEYARNAFRAYGANHPRLPVFAHDLAYFWMTRGRFAEALAVFQAVLPLIKHPNERLLAWGDVGRAAGGAGSREVFERAWEEVWSYAGEWDNRLHAAQALLDLARGAASLKEWARAERAATTARDVATRREEARVLVEVEPLLESIMRRRNLESVQAEAGETPDEDTALLAADLLRTLETAAARK
jgi:tetratricopeptide (TPR) repeat protein